MPVFFWYLAIIPVLLFGVTLCCFSSRRPEKDEVTERRVASILKRMTLEEKLDYIGGVDRFFIRPVPHLGIPKLKMADGPLGIRNYGPSTAMAAGIALAASWDVSLAERIGSEIAREARSKGVHFLLGPGVNLYRAPMNGRNFEYFGEDPYLAASMTIGYVRGVQSRGVCATVKHFIANNSEFDRRKSDAVIDERALREIYLAAFEAAVGDAGVGAVMTSYNRTNGFYMSQNGSLVREILKDEWSFDGVVMSDWTSTYDGIEAANGGLDLEMPSAAAMNRRTLRQAIEEGTVTKETIDDKVRRILRTAVRFGWLDREQTDLSVPDYSRDGSATALDAARSSMVLLKNEGERLPFQKGSVQKLAVVGPNAHPAVPSGGGSARVVPYSASSFVKGLSDLLEGVADVYTHPGIPSLSEIADRTQLFTSPDGRRPGLRLELFDSTDLSEPPTSVCIEKHVGAGEYFSTLPRPFSSARWTGYFRPQAAGDYQVFVQIPGERIGYRLYVEDALVIDAWDYSKALLDTSQVSMDGRAYKVVLELVRRGDGFSGGKLRLGIVRPDSLVDPEALALAEQAEAVVVAVGFNDETESESGDRTFALPPGQDALIGEIAQTNENTVVVITSGGSVDMNQWHKKVPAIIAAWYPGQEGGTALAEILMGDTNPSGRLPISLEETLQENPAYDNYYPESGTDQVIYREGLFVGYRGFEKNSVTPLFPFGHGLSYTRFHYSNLLIESVEEDSADDILFEVSFDLKNSGDRSGADVAQLYVGSSVSGIERPQKELKGFKKVMLAPGERRRVTIKLNRRAFCYYDTKVKDWIVQDGEHEICIGRSSAEIVLKGKVSLV